MFIFSCSQDSNVASHAKCTKGTQDSFLLSVVRFAGQTTGNLVWITVTAVVCSTKTLPPANICEQQCTSCKRVQRRRRTTLEESLKAEYFLKYGPIKVAHLSEEEKEKGLSFQLVMVNLSKFDSLFLNISKTHLKLLSKS